MSLYETTFAVRQDVSKNELETIVSEISEAITSSSAKILKTEEWGLLNLAYIIKKNKKAHYIHLVIEAEPTLPDIVYKEYKHRSKDIIRHLTVSIDSFSEKPTHMLRAAQEAA